MLRYHVVGKRVGRPGGWFKRVSREGVQSYLVFEAQV